MFNLKPRRFPCLLQFRFCSSSSSSTYNYLSRFLSNQSPTLQNLLQSHASIITSGNASNLFFAAKLVSLYSYFNKSSSSRKIFNSVAFKDAFLWNSMIKSFFSNGQYPETLDFYEMMRFDSLFPDSFTIPMVVTACGELMLLDYGENLHGLCSKLGLFLTNPAVGSSFVYMYSKCGVMGAAHLVFDQIPVRDVVAWTALVNGYVQNGESEKGLECIREMHRNGDCEQRPNFRTMEGGFQACADLGAIGEGRCLHGLAAKMGSGSSQMVQNSLLSMYAKWGSPDEAHLSFDEVLDQDVISWTSIIGVYARLGSMTECLSMFFEMLDAGICPDGILVSCIVLGFGKSMRSHDGKTFHALIIRKHYELNEVVHNAFLAMYCNFGLLIPAEKIFLWIKGRSTESWNTMISEYSQMGFKDKSIELFRNMQWLGLKSDVNSLVSVIAACSQLGSILVGRSLHSYVIKSSENRNISVLNSLIGMYGKFRDLTAALRIFCRSDRDVVSWNTLMSAHIHNGNFNEVVKLFDKMILENFQPDVATLVTVLSACSQLASPQHGKNIHKYIKDTGFDCSLSVATSLIDMYMKCGELIKAREIFDSVKERDVICWNVMISGYGMHGDAESALELFRQMENSSIRPNGLTFLAILGACAHAGLVEEGKRCFCKMQEYSVRPNLKHYASMVDLLGRSGNLHEAEALVLSMPVSPDGGVWGALLNACKIHNEIDMGIRIAKRAIESEPENDGYYILASNMCSSTGRWEEADRMRVKMRERRVGKIAGWSAI